MKSLQGQIISLVQNCKTQIQQGKTGVSWVLWGEYLSVAQKRQMGVFQHKPTAEKTMITYLVYFSATT